MQQLLLKVFFYDVHEVVSVKWVLSIDFLAYQPISRISLIEIILGVFIL